MASEELDPVWKALADPTRRELLDLLRTGARTTGELASAFPMSRIGVMKHLAILESAGLVVTRKDGRQRWNHLNAVPLRRIYERWVSRYESDWAQSLLTLGRAVEKEHEMSKTMELGTIHIEQETNIAAPREKVFAALTEGIDGWWRHRLSKGPSRLTLEPKLGGLFVERAEDGEGAIWGTVTRLKKNEYIELNGPLGMDRPLVGLYRFTLKSTEGGTTLQLSHKVAGDIDPAWREGYSQGWQALWVELEKYVTTGKRFDA